MKKGLIIRMLLAFILIFTFNTGFVTAASETPAKVIENLKKQVKDLTNKIKVKDKEINTLKSQAKTKDNEIVSLKEQIKVLNAKLNPPKPKPIDKISSSNLPYTHKAGNGMELTINSYTADSNGVKMNFTIKNNSSVSDKGQLMTSTWEIFDGKNTLKFIDQDRIFWDTDYLRAGQSVTGDVIFKGLSQTTDTFSLYGSLWQYIDAEEFKLTFKVE